MADQLRRPLPILWWQFLPCYESMQKCTLSFRLWAEIGFIERHLIHWREPRRISNWQRSFQRSSRSWKTQEPANVFQDSIRELFGKRSRHWPWKERLLFVNYWVYSRQLTLSCPRSAIYLKLLHGAQHGNHGNRPRRSHRNWCPYPNR